MHISGIPQHSFLVVRPRLSPTANVARLAIERKTLAAVNAAVNTALQVMQLGQVRARTAAGWEQYPHTSMARLVSSPFATDARIARPARRREQLQFCLMRRRSNDGSIFTERMC
jgi:hypothetical protein